MRLVDIELDIAAPREIVFDLFATAEGLCEWMAVDATVNATVGGDWTWTHDDGATCSGAYLEIDRPRRLVFTYGWDRGPFEDVRAGSTTVEVTLLESDEGTSLKLRHTGLSPERADQHNAGWSHFLALLATRAQSGTKE